MLSHVRHQISGKNQQTDYTLKNFGFFWNPFGLGRQTILKKEIEPAVLRCPEIRFNLGSFEYFSVASAFSLSLLDEVRAARLK
jgi:hypothetical protein